MSRDWLAVYTATIHHPKYRRLSIPGKATLFHVWLLATVKSPEAYWSSRDALADDLELDGFDSATIDELITRRWLDAEDDGGIAVHDWDVHQHGASKAIRDHWEAERKRRWRRDVKSKSSPPAPPSLKNRSQPQPQDAVQPQKAEQNSTGVPDTSGQRPDTGGRDAWEAVGETFREERATG
jgi:hypothetical protein